MTHSYESVSEKNRLNSINKLVYCINLSVDTHNDSSSSSSTNCFTVYSIEIVLVKVHL